MTESIPSAQEKKKPRPKDVFGRALPTEEQFEVLKNAPRCVHYSVDYHHLANFSMIIFNFVTSAEEDFISICLNNKHDI